MLPATGLELAASGLQFPEGPASDGKGSIYCSNCSADYITRLLPDGQVDIPYRANRSETGAFTFHKANGMIFHEDGSLWLCDFGRNAIVRISPGGTQQVMTGSCDGAAFRAPNDLVFAPSGSLYFTDPGGSGRDNPIGALYCLNMQTQKTVRAAEGMAFPNGLAFTEDGRTLYVCESQLNRIVRFDVNPDGSLGPLHEFASLKENGPGEPDGMALDVRGHLWIAHYAAHSVLELNPQGSIVGRIQMPVEKNQGPTNVEFAGSDMRTLYITDPSTESLYRIRVEFPGLPLFCSPSRRLQKQGILL